MDANLDGKAASDAVLNAGFELRRCRDVFEDGTPDEEVIPRVAKEGWLFFSKDRTVAKDPGQRAILKETNSRAFFFGRADLTKDQIAASLEIALPKVVRLLKKKGRRGKGVIRRISTSGELVPF